MRIWDQEGNVSAWSPVNEFCMGLLSEKDWNKASWISLEKDKKDEIITTGVHGLGEVDRKFRPDQKIGMYALPQFRKEFDVKKPLKRAIAYVSGLGHFDMFLNGEKVGNHFLDPGWTKYDRCALYVPFDITQQLHAGKNAVGVMLGNGFFNVPRERYFKLITSYGAPRLLMNIRLSLLKIKVIHRCCRSFLTIAPTIFFSYCLVVIFHSLKKKYEIIAVRYIKDVLLKWK